MITIRFIDTATSTNDIVRQSNTPFLMISALTQEDGRGQRGNSWESEPGKNLTFSFIIIPDFLPFQKQFYISKIVSNSLILTLKSFNIKANVKWPNDIYIDDEKICGILIENDITSSGSIIRSIIGVGLNVNQSHFTSNAPNPTSMYLKKNIQYDLKEVATVFAKKFEQQYKQLEAENYNQIDTFYFDNLYRLNNWHTFRDKDGKFKGRIIKVEPAGNLIIEKENKQQNSYLFKEVEYIII